MDQPYIGKTCPYCQFTLKQDSEAVICCDCKIPHHKECWHENGGCTTFGCKGVISGGSDSREILDITLEERADERITLPVKNKTGKIFAAVIACGVVMFLIANTFLTNLPLFNIGSVIDPSVIAALDADYYIDFDNGTIPIGELPIGARVVDPSWEWEFRLGVNYSDMDWDGDPTEPVQIKPVIWIVVAKDHYDLDESHVTLLVEELIGRFAFDNSTNRSHAYAEYGYNHWGDSGTANATNGLRPWLNSSGIHAGEGFYQAFSKSFNNAVLTTTVPNREWKNGSTYSTQDRVFIPSTTELGDTAHRDTYQIGSAYPFFQGAGAVKRVARIGRETWWYWTRSPDSYSGNCVRFVGGGGEFYYIYDYADYSNYGVRPVLNLKSEILVSEIP